MAVSDATVLCLCAREGLWSMLEQCWPCMCLHAWYTRCRCLQVAVPGGEQQTFRLGQPLSPMRLHGGVLGGVSPDGQQVAVKLGPAPRDRRMAEALCLRRERWAQVRRLWPSATRGAHLPRMHATGKARKQPTGCHGLLEAGDVRRLQLTCSSQPRL